MIPWRRSRSRTVLARTLMATIALAMIVPSLSATPVRDVGHAAAAIATAATTLRENYTPGWTDVSHGLGENEVPDARTGSAGAYYPTYTSWVLYGGRNATGQTLSETMLFVTGEAEWDPLDQFWNGSRPPSPPPLSGAVLTYDAADGYMLLFGGQLSNGSDYGGTWTFSGANWNVLQWTQVTVSGGLSPPPSSADRMAYDSTDGYVVLYTGTGSTPTWNYRAGTWSPITAVQGPASRQQSALADDPDLGGVVLFGGSTMNPDAPYLNDSWLYRNGNWTTLPFPAGPPPMSAPIGVYDASDGYLLLAGGTRGQGGLYGQESTWGLAPNGWSNLSGTSGPVPPPRYGAVIVYDPLDGTVLLYGGTNHTGVALGDMWAWNLPSAAADSRIAAFPISPQILFVVGIGGVVPPVLAWAYFRRPPRRLPTDVPSPAPAPA